MIKSVDNVIKEVSDSYFESWTYDKYPSDTSNMERYVDDCNALRMDWSDMIDLAQDWIDETGAEIIKDLRSQIESMACCQLDSKGWEHFTERVEVIQRVVSDLESDGFDVEITRDNGFGWTPHVRELDRFGFTEYVYENVEGEINISIIEIDGIFLNAQKDTD